MTKILNADQNIKNNLNKCITNKNQLVTNASALVSTLAELNINTVFGYPGASVLSVYEELSKVSKIKHILVRHEQAAVHMAEGYAKISDKPAVVLVTSGPGVTNTITGIANAYADSTPLIVLAGDIARNNCKGKIFQKVDIINLTKTCCKKNYLLTAKDDIKQILKEAYNIANSGKKGPVVITLPRNILESKYIEKTKKRKIFKREFEISNFEYRKIINLIKKSKSPLILLGGGAINSVENIDKLVNLTKIPVISTLMGIGTFPSTNPLYLGMIGINGSYPANTAINSADLVLAFGVSFSDRTTCKNNKFMPNAKIVNINIKKSSKKFDTEIIYDSNEFIHNLLKKINPKNIPNLTSWYKKIQTLKEENNTKDSEKKYLQSSKVLDIISQVTQNLNPIVVTDVGQHQLLTAQYFNFNQPKKFVTSGGLGTMGFGLPAAIGAYIANPKSLVLNITGDGSFQMNLQELATCREHNIPIKIIILNNGYLGMVRQLQEHIYNNRYQVEMINPDFTKIAEAYDLCAFRVTKSEEIIPALQKAISIDKTVIIDIAIDSFEEI